MNMTTRFALPYIGCLLVLLWLTGGLSIIDTDTILIGALLLLVAIIYAVEALKRRRRYRELASFASNQGFAFSTGGTPTADLFTAGAERRSRGTLRGVIDSVDLEAFEYRVTYGNGVYTRWQRHYHVIVAKLSHRPAHLIATRDNNWGRWWTTVEGGTFPTGDQRFDSIYRVNADDMKTAKAALHQYAIDVILEAMPLHVVWTDDRVMFVYPGYLNTENLMCELRHAASLRNHETGNGAVTH